MAERPGFVGRAFLDTLAESFECFVPPFEHEAKKTIPVDRLRQVSVHNSLGRSECMGNGPSRPSHPGTPNRKRSYDTMSGADEENSQNVESLEQDLEGVESRLEHASSPGRAVFDSLGSALGSIRGRLQQLQSSSPPAAAGPTNTITSLSERLTTAERAHSSRMPLGLLRSHISTASHSGSSVDSSEVTRNQAMPTDDTNLKEDVDAKENIGGSSRRRPSTLVASRRYAEAQETNDIALHEGGHLPNLGVLEESGGIEVTLTQDSVNTHESSVILPQASIQKLESSLNATASLLLRTSTLQEKVPETPKAPPAVATTTMYTWGSSDDYNLFGPASGMSVVVDKPQLVPADSRVGRSRIVNLSVSSRHAALATATGSLLVCGNNSEGAVDPSQRDVNIPRPMHLEQLAMNRILQVSCGLDHTAVLTESRSVLTFGNNSDGQLGHRQLPSSQSRHFQSPAAMVLPRRAAQVVCGHGFTLALTTRMEVYVCGREELSGYSTLDGPPRLPEQKPSLQGLPLVYVAAGHEHAVVVTAHGTAYSWGSNPNGACGRCFPKSIIVPVPIQVPPSRMGAPQSPTNTSKPFPNWAEWERGSPITLAEDVAVLDACCGGDHTVLVTWTGDLLVTGNNQQGQLGLDVDKHSAVASVERTSHPVDGTRFVSAQAGECHTLLLDSVGDVWSMGNGQTSMTRVLTGKRIASIAAGGKLNLAVASSSDECQISSPAPHKGLIPCTTVPTTATPGLEGLLDGILLEKEVAKQESVVQELAKQTEELFCCPAVMNSLFLDPKEIDDLYSKLISAAGEQKYRQQVVSAMEKGMVRGLEGIRSARLMYPESIRCLLLYLQCPLFRTDEAPDLRFDIRGEVILSLCETILGLPFEGYKAFLAWSTSIYAKELFVLFLVKPLMDQLDSKMKTDRTRAVPPIVGVLRWLQNVADRSDDVLSTPADFHSQGVEELQMESLFDDWQRFKNASKQERAVNFFLCANQFLLSPTTKRNLLQVENQMTMVHAAQAQGVQYDAARREFLFQPYFVLAVDRQYLLQQTLQMVGGAAPGELRKSLKVVFKGEDGVDAGGVTKEFFQLLVIQLFDVNTGMWSMEFGDGLHTWFNADCSWNHDGFYLVGVLLGLAVYNSVILDVHLPPTVYRKLLGLPLGIEDMVDEEVRRGLQSLLDYEGDDVESVFCLSFEVTWNSLGVEQKRELKPGGSNIPVTNGNREEYVLLYVKWLLVDSIKTQYEEFERGFMQVMEGSSLDVLLPEELELLVVGTPDLDFVALENNTEYEGGLEKESAVVTNLWRFIQQATREEQRQFLKFCTGGSKAPIGGLGAMPFKVQRAGPDSMQLPTSHTCFNTLLIPDYGDDYEKLAERLGRAIKECEGFGLQ